MGKKDAHHGGAWKVAYADFVTAMMALFIVLWIIKERPEMAEIIAATFRKPLIGQKGGRPEDVVLTPGVDREKLVAEQELEKLQKIAAEMQKIINSDDPDDKSMDVQVTGDGLRLNIYD